MTRTRFAPSPTGFIHIGNLRTALFAYLIAKHDNGEFILRIEDTDKSRNEQGALEFIYEMLYTFNLIYDEGPNKESDNTNYIQSNRLEIYKSYAEQLLKKGDAYYCFCDKSLLNQKRVESAANKQSYLYEDPCSMIGMEEAKNRVLARESYCIRQRIPKDGRIGFNDLVYGEISFPNNVLDNQILIKSDGFPTFNFASVIDDALMNISHITRGVEYISNTPKSILLYDALNLQIPLLVHLPLVVNKDKKKLSKRNKEENLLDLLQVGFLPSAIINYIALLGWSPKTNQEFFTLEELIEVFDIKNISKRPCCYDINKLKWYNKHYIQKLTDDEYINFVRPFLEAVYNISDKSDIWIIKLLLLFKSHISFGSEISLLSKTFFESSISLDENGLNYLKNNNETSLVINSFKEEINNIEWTEENIRTILKNVEIKTNQNNVYMIIRIVTTGIMQGRELSKVLYLLGKENIINRLNDIDIYLEKGMMQIEIL